MSSSIQLRRLRGLELELSRGRIRDRRPCRLAGLGADGPAPSAPRDGVRLERLGTDSAVLRVSGELDLASVPALERVLRHAERLQLASLIVDAADLAFVDLSVVGWLARAHAQLGVHGGGVLVVHPPDCLLRILDVVDVEVPVLS